MSGLHILNQIYEENGNDIWSILELYKQLKVTGLNAVHIVRLLSIANNDIPLVEYRIKDLDKQEATINFRIRQAAATFQRIDDDITNEKKTLELYYSEAEHVEQEIARLRMEKTRLENFESSFQVNNEACIKIKHIVKKEIETFMSNPRALLRFAIASIFESSRRHPGKFHTMYYNMSSVEIQSLVKLTKL